MPELTMPDIERAIKPCPCCGGKASVQPAEDQPRWYVECQSCGLCKFDRSEAEAIEAWNSRPSDSVMELAQKVADCKNAVDEISPKDFYLLSAMKARMELTKSIDALAAALPRKS